MRIPKLPQKVIKWLWNKNESSFQNLPKLKKVFTSYQAKKLWSCNWTWQILRYKNKWHCNFSYHFIVFQNTLPLKKSLPLLFSLTLRSISDQKMSSPSPSLLAEVHHQVFQKKTVEGVEQWVWLLGRRPLQWGSVSQETRLPAAGKLERNELEHAVESGLLHCLHQYWPMGILKWKLL